MSDDCCYENPIRVFTVDSYGEFESSLSNCYFYFFSAQIDQGIEKP